MIFNALIRKSAVPGTSRILDRRAGWTARGDPDALGARIVAALGEAGYRIVPANGWSTPRSVRSLTGWKQLYHNPNGDTCFLARDPATGLALIRHEANATSGGGVSDIDVGAFLSDPPHPEQAALLRRIGSLMVSPQGADAHDEPPPVRTGREWSDHGRALIAAFVAGKYWRPQGDSTPTLILTPFPVKGLVIPTICWHHL